MRVLNTATAVPQQFPSPEAVPGGYAILSHVWITSSAEASTESEQSFQDIEALLKAQGVNLDTDGRRCEASGVNIRNEVATKTRKFCEIAEKHGYQWAWTDTCCINKTSSAELSETINSMCQYYSRSDVCFVYLHDVHHNEDLPKGFDEAEFQNSKWHTRGWTLQELLAPKFVIFLASNWEMLGTKASLASLIEQRTKIPTCVLKFEQDLSTVSIGQRMSWASGRRTSRPEDEAYCLLGIFGINMATLYGEGQNAFYRLQEELMKTSPDMSLFAWGRHEPEPSLNPPRDDSTQQFLSSQYLFASSPRPFASCANITFDRRSAIPGSQLTHERLEPPSPSTLPEDGPKTPSFSITPHGVLAWAPVIELDKGSRLVMILSRLSRQPISESSESPSSQLIGLYLTSLQTPEGNADSHLPMFRTGVPKSSYRCVCLPANDYSKGITWKRFYVLARPEFRSDTTPPQLLPLVRMLTADPTPPFRLPHSILAQFTLPDAATNLNHVTPLADHGPDAVAPPMALFFRFIRKDLVTFGSQQTHTFISITLGLCGVEGADSNRDSRDSSSELAPRTHYVRILVHSADPWDECFADKELYKPHSCSRDHVSDGTYRKELIVKFMKSPSAIYRAVCTTLRFVPCLLNPQQTLVLKEFNISVESI